MTDPSPTRDSAANVLCKACGLCCTGHLFIWSKLRSAELDGAESLGLKVIREPRQRGFNQPCPLWDGQCTVYTSPHYPHFCRTYKCALLKRVMDEATPLSNALGIVQQTQSMIEELERLLPVSANPNFRERLVELLEHLEAAAEWGRTDAEFLLKAKALLAVYETQFGVKDLIVKPVEE